MIERYEPNIYIGLNQEQVQQRIRAKMIHEDSIVTTKSIKEIILSNTITLFNMLNIMLGVLIILTGSYKNLLFLGVAFCNTIISLAQEIHAKRIIDRLSIISSTKITLIRNGKEDKYHINDIVLDDIIKYSLGNQIVVDSIIKDGSVEVDESFITGESNTIIKNRGDMLLSGSFIVSGVCTASVEHIGVDNYTNKISKEAKYIKKPNSEIMTTIQKIIKAISIVIIPLGILLFLQQMQLEGNTFNDSVINTVAALIAMIPEGLVLLISTVLAVGSIRLANHRVLVQELFCIETLARVDTICLDKTGTITTGEMEVIDTISLNNKYNVEEILVAISNYNVDNNSTAKAIKEKFKGETKYKMLENFPFSSKNKYSGIGFEEGKYLIGAPEFLTEEKKILNNIKEYSDYRVLLLVESDKTNIPIAFILIRDKIRKSASETLKYFKDQGVDVKIISGDNVSTIEKIARRVGLMDVKGIDMSTTSKEDNLKELVKKYNVFGRVSPSEKKDLILAIKANGNTVAMTGDGVNDVLALKEADCSIAMASGSDAARSVSQLVLLDSNFDSIPKIVNEGRRSINNLERSATLFLTKTMYSTLLAILFLFINMNYPFQPIQLSLNSIVAIGIPSFILALEPNNSMVQGKFIMNVIKKSIPAAFTIVVNVISVMIFASIFKLQNDYISTMAMFLLAFTGFQLLYKICYPFNYIRGILFGGLTGIFLGGSIGLKSLFDLVILTPFMFLFVILLCMLDIPLFNTLSNVCEKKIFKYKERILR
jgi:ATPase, P-type (transporting), HAD superfamily, subfamily IC